MGHGLLAGLIESQRHRGKGKQSRSSRSASVLARMFHHEATKKRSRRICSMPVAGTSWLRFFVVKRKLKAFRLPGLYGRTIVEDDLTSRSSGGAALL